MIEQSHFHIAIKGLVTYQGKFLILKRPQRHGETESYWELPGGGLSFREAPETALKRELTEEVALEVKVVQPIHVWNRMKNETTQIIGITFLCESESDEVKISHEHLDYAWISPNEQEKYNLLPDLKADMDQWDWSKVLK
ncbi:hypothetical protein BHU72_09210 [Desulfuribacillus stibiiarsenatis]|uniref:Nudix hydrolase domain-containing protein n=1 Tax=Desulfuribacillus stibiiarsenatis TaxID=1390249 RepID=A0A1E5L3E2_9FIRM|nr:NUDIX domain-containing protein [Desulfuribacillus stibiiarsenatis]OEH84660.1 hypothetical protein BHU72_09210 [Desulfuribacillus stibiiarsenatis]